MVDLPLASGIPVHCAHHAIVPLHELKPRPDNPNRHPEAQLILYAAAIKARGWRESITVSRLSGFIVTGEGALLAARKLGVDSAPVEYQDYASVADELADVVAHNRLPELSKTDADRLKDIIAKLGTGIATTAGFSEEAVAKMLEEIAPEPQYPIVARLNESHHLLCIPVESETDWIWLKSLLGIEVQRSYKNATTGEAHVVPFAQCVAQLRANVAMITPRE